MRRYWTTVEMAKLRLTYPNRPTAELAKESGRTASAVSQMAQKLGLHKSEEFKAVSPMMGRWQEGNKPWNFGRHYQSGGRSNLTRFKKGHRGARQLPVGSERRCTRGWWSVKVAEPSVWVSKARYVWEKNFGKIPQGSIVRFRDRNEENFAPENLFLVTLAEHIRMNSRPRWRAKRRALAWTAPARLAA